MRNGELTYSVRVHDNVPPEFQQESVWVTDQNKNMLSLVKDNPFRTLLLWKTNTPSELKTNLVTYENLGREKGERNYEM